MLVYPFKILKHIIKSAFKRTHKTPLTTGYSRVYNNLQSQLGQGVNYEQFKRQLINICVEKYLTTV